MTTQHAESTVVTPPSNAISLVPRALTSNEKMWLGVISFVGGSVVWLFVDSLAIAVLLGGVMRAALPMIVGTSGESRRFAVAINVMIYGGLLAVLAAAYNSSALLELIR